jgi:hypothetical protein
VIGGKKHKVLRSLKRALDDSLDVGARRYESGPYSAA